MALLKAFRGFRPPKEIVKDLASRPYDVLNSDEARAEAEKACASQTSRRELHEPEVPGLKHVSLGIY